ncbi:hypothetical protein SpCBS45565_g00998 [Spizellomyces sp. 'palustris']|nr:hypothetical protein SpCBS45565_g00998 [Spizellomyces sp. 'palustris']
MTSFMSMEQLVDQACDTEYAEPNVALMLEICDLINQKGRSLPREAALAIVRNVNSRNNQSALHALLLLDYCVKNCGYPFHLIVSTKEFLNELVRRFPERPANVNMVQHRILELIQQWNATLCVTSRYKDDFKHINDMYRLLSYKGYRFPPLSKDAEAVLNPSHTFKTEEELEQEDKIAQGAKLQELLRQGTPAALEQANDLMKIMSGYDTERVPNYKKQVEEELNRIEQRAILLNDILIQKSPEDRWRPDSTVEELLGSAKSAQSRIQKLISSGEEDEKMGRLLELNDLINMVINKHADFKAGKPIEGAVQKSSASPSSKETNQGKPGPVSLIDLDDWGAPGPATPPIASPPTGSPQKQQPQQQQQQASGLGGLLDDLSSLNFTATPAVSSSSSVPATFGPSLIDGSSGAGFPQLQPLGTPGSGASSPALVGQPLRPQGQAPPIAGGQNLASFGGYSAGNTPQSTGTPQPRPAVPSNLGWTAAPSSVPGTPPFQSKVDPFGGVDLFGKLAGISQAGSAPATPPALSAPGTPSGGATGASNVQQRKEVMIFDKNGLQVKYRLLWKGNAWAAQAVFINVTPVPFTNLVFQVAAPKSMTLNMEPASGTVLPPLNQGQVTQGMQIVNPNKEPLRMRFKLQYAVNGAVVNEQGDYAES